MRRNVCIRPEPLPSHKFHSAEIMSFLGPKNLLTISRARLWPESRFLVIVTALISSLIEKIASGWWFGRVCVCVCDGNGFSCWSTTFRWTFSIFCVLFLLCRMRKIRHELRRNRWPEFFHKPCLFFCLFLLVSVIRIWCCRSTNRSKQT